MTGRHRDLETEWADSVKITYGTRSSVWHFVRMIHLLAKSLKKKMFFTHIFMALPFYFIKEISITKPNNCHQVLTIFCPNMASLVSYHALTNIDDILNRNESFTFPD